MVIPQLFYSARGTPLSAYHRIRDLIAMGHEVEVLTYGLGDPPPDLPIVVHRAKGPHFARSIQQGPSLLKIWFDVLLFVSFVRLLLGRRYDLVYTHEEAGFLAALICPPLRVPFVYDMHSSLPLQIRDWGFSDLEAVVAIFRFVERFHAEARARRRRDLARCHCGGARELAGGAGRHDPEPLRAGGEGFPGRRPPHPREPRARSRASGRAVCGHLREAPGPRSPGGRRSPSSLRAARGVRFVLVGGTKSEIETLLRQADALGVRDKVVLVEHRPQREMPAFMAAADVLVSPRVKGINPPGKLFSYLDSGKPVVATDRPIHNQILESDFSILTSADAAGLPRDSSPR